MGEAVQLWFAVDEDTTGSSMAEATNSKAHTSAGMAAFWPGWGDPDEA